LLAILFAVGCVQQGVPSPAVLPAATITPSPSIGPIITPTIKPTITPSPSPAPENQILVDSTYLCGDYGDESAFVQFRGPSIFLIQASFQTNCAKYVAYWTVSKAPFPVLEVDFRQVDIGERVCMKCLGMDHVTAVLNLSYVDSPTLLEKIIIKREGKLIAEKIFKGAFCGGIAAFQCPSGYECMLDGSYPDAGGECILGIGVLQGNVALGPICPVERQDVPCPVPPEAYTSRKLIATGPLPFEKATQININASGSYSINLAPGTYSISLNDQSMGRGSNLPATVTIRAGEATTFDVDIDTGIR
ncbi:MAG: hypothetical protein AABX01_05595, partial [Candidatus Micrarchaeota archaeon]